MSEKIYLLCIFGNERELMPYFLRYYAPQVDQLIMYDGCSTDESKAMIKAYSNAVIKSSPFTPQNFTERGLSDYFADECYKLRDKADWVIVVDVDEFMYAPQGLRTMLKQCRRRNVIAIKAKGYQMIAERCPTEDGQLIDLVHRGMRDTMYDKTVVFDPEIKVKWTRGRHNCNIEAPYMGLKLLHYRYLGEAFLNGRNARNAIWRGSDGYIIPQDENKYSPEWWKQARIDAEEVING